MDKKNIHNPIIAKLLMSIFISKNDVKKWSIAYVTIVICNPIFAKFLMFVCQFQSNIV